ncbi:MAG TPA: hypothetical protein VIV60_14075 [Polyangiaceae bacterium]
MSIRALALNAAQRVRWQTPDEMYFGQGVDISGELVARRREARRRRVDLNQRIDCSTCPSRATGAAQEIAA